MNYNLYRYFTGLSFILIAGVVVLWDAAPLHGQGITSGIASYYHDKLVGNKTASGEVFQQDKFTAAHKSLPFNTWVLVCDHSGHEVVVRINDRLPANSSRIIDLTTRAFKRLTGLRKGLIKVNIKVITEEEAGRWCRENGFEKSELVRR